MSHHNHGVVCNSIANSVVVSWPEVVIGQRATSSGTTISTHAPSPTRASLPQLPQWSYNPRPRLRPRLRLRLTWGVVGAQLLEADVAVGQAASEQRLRVAHIGDHEQVSRHERHHRRRRAAIDGLSALRKCGVLLVQYSAGFADADLDDGLPALLQAGLKGRCSDRVGAVVCLRPRSTCSRSTPPCPTCSGCPAARYLRTTALRIAS